MWNIYIESICTFEYNKNNTLLFYGGHRMEYLTSADCAKKWNISQRRVAIYCKEGRIEGTIMMGGMWMIPKDAKKTDDPRKIKKQKKEN